MDILDEFIGSVRRQLAMGKLIATNQTYHPFTLKLPIYFSFSGSDKYFPQWRSGNHALLGVYYSDSSYMRIYNKINDELHVDLRRAIENMPGQEDYLNRRIKMIECDNCLQQTEIGNPFKYKKLKITFTLTNPPPPPPPSPPSISCTGSPLFQ